MHARLLLCVMLAAAGVMVAGPGLLVAMRYIDQPGPFNEFIFCAVGGGMSRAGIRRWRKRHHLGAGTRRAQNSVKGRQSATNDVELRCDVTSTL